MNLNNFTIKSQEAVQKAQQIAFNHQNPVIETEHLLSALLADEDSPVEFLLKKNNVNTGFVASKLEESINKLPKVSGGEPAQTISRDMNNVVLRATATLKTFNDEFISVEHLLLAIVQGNDNTAKLLKDAGLTEKGMVAAIKDLKKGSTISSQGGETQFNALNKYAKKISKMLQKKKFASLEEEANYYAQHKEIITNPGKEFFYGDVGYVVAGRVLEVVAKKKTFSRLMQERITRPLAMRKTSFMNDSGGEDPSGGAVSSADDLAKFLTMLLNKGEMYGKRILSEKSVDEMEKIQFAGLPVKFAPKMTQGHGYGYGVWIQDADKSGKPAVIDSPGLNGTWSYIDRCRNIAAVIFGKQTENDQNPAPYLELKDVIGQQFKSNCN